MSRKGCDDPAEPESVARPLAQWLERPAGLPAARVVSPPIHLPPQQPPGSFQNTSPIVSVTLESLPCSPLNRSSLEPYPAPWLTRQARPGPSDLDRLRPHPTPPPPPVLNH